MSLASRIANLFGSPNNQQQQLTTSDHRHQIPFGSPRYEDGQDKRKNPRQAEKHAQTVEEEEEERARPPYLRVSDSS